MIDPDEIGPASQKYMIRAEKMVSKLDYLNTDQTLQVAQVYAILAVAAAIKERKS